MESYDKNKYSGKNLEHIKSVKLPSIELRKCLVNPNLETVNSSIWIPGRFSSFFILWIQSKLKIDKTEKVVVIWLA